MVIKSDAEIYRILEELLRKSGEEPQTCVDLYKDQRVKKLADSPNRVSDYLGHMWRRGELQRWFSNNPGQRARYAYTIKEKKDEGPKKVEQLSVVRNLASKPNVTITEEEDRIVLDFPQFTITVQSKRNE